MSDLLDPDYWVTVWNKLIDPAFWGAVWSKLIDPDFWVTAWKAFSTPEVAIPLIALLLIALYVGVKIKGAIEAGKIKGMKHVPKRPRSGWRSRTNSGQLGQQLKGK